MANDGSSVAPGASGEVFIVVPADARYAASWPAEFERLDAALRVAGIEARALPMTAMPPRGSTVLALLAWGYHLAPQAWLSQVAAWEAAGARLINPATVLRWNMRKTYLVELCDAGLPVVPTIAHDMLSQACLAEARQRFAVETLVAKPQVGACAHGAMVLTPGIAPAATGPVILQPFVPTILHEGELSLVFLGGRFSHAVHKQPKPGDFRVQAEHGGRVKEIEAPEDALETAQAILAAVSLDLAYARVDLVRDEAGSYRLMELELIEPQLFMQYGAIAPALLGAALEKALQAGARLGASPEAATRIAASVSHGGAA